MKSSIPQLASLLLVLATFLCGQTPEMFYYRFNEQSGALTANQAIPGVGTLTAPIVGHTLFPAPFGQFQDGCLNGAGGTSYVSTGWQVAFGTGAWTISFWLDHSAGTSLSYLFGDPTAFQFRCFSNGAAGAGNVILRGGSLVDVIIAGGAVTTAPQICAFAYDPTGPVIRAYRNGVLVNTVAQPALNITSTANFRVGGQVTGMLPGIKLDEFRVYNRTVPDAELAATWNIPLAGPSAQLSVVGTGCAGTGGLSPVLSSSQLPILGNGSFSVAITLAAPNSLTWLYLSSGLAAAPLPLGGSCNVYLEITSLFNLIATGLIPFGPLPTGPGGMATFPLPVPNDPGLAGALIGLQAAIGDPAATLGFTVTNALGALLY